MNLRIRITALALTLACAAPHASAQTVGAVLPPWTAGGLDIHHINTGEGSAAFLILPDGTTLLIDCGDGSDMSRPPRYKAPPLPDASRTPGDWVVRYLQKFHPAGASAAVDYLLISHFHSDHMGGVPDLLRQVQIRKVLDRGEPDISKTAPFTSKLADRYHAALKDQSTRHGTKVEAFKPGVADQIVLVKDAAKFPTFEVRNIAANAQVWTGTGTEVRARMPAGVVANENCSSNVLRLRYGGFDYFSGGDIPGVPGGEISTRLPLVASRARAAEWTDIESPVAWVTGPVDVCVLNHHGGQDTTNAFFLSVVQPRVCIAQVWATPQVTAEVLKRIRSETIYPGPRDIFTTNGVWEGRKEHLIEAYGAEPAARHIEDLKNLTATQGHIVVRVAPGGASYQIFMLDDSRESYEVRSVHGPYESR